MATGIDPAPALDSQYSGKKPAVCRPSCRACPLHGGPAILGVDTLRWGRLNGFARECGRAGRGHGQKRKGQTMMRMSFMAAVLIAASAGAALAQDVEKGQKSFNKCLPCHSIGDDAQNKIGPELNGLDGRHSGTVANFSYSDANKNSGIVWDEANFKEYIKDPKAKIPGTKMIFAGIKNEQEISDLWAYLKQFDADGNIKK
jgi:cytochrome c